MNSQNVGYGIIQFIKLGKGNSSHPVPSTANALLMHCIAITDRSQRKKRNLRLNEKSKIVTDKSMAWLWEAFYNERKTRIFEPI
jgi:hypothetical protein